MYIVEQSPRGQFRCYEATEEELIAILSEGRPAVEYRVLTHCEPGIQWPSQARQWFKQDGVIMRIDARYYRVLEAPPLTDWIHRHAAARFGTEMRVYADRAHAERQDPAFSPILHQAA